jgi:photosystem II stability/assembly factor-like uncharacterized protein
MNAIVKRLKTLVTAIAAIALLAGCSHVASLENNPWEVLSLPTETNFIDVAFTDNLERGWLVGDKATLLETTDQGETWELRRLELDNENIRLKSIDFSGREGWIVGEPSLLLHTENGGQSWTRVQLSDKLPGEPNTIAALGPHSAEMTTDVGAIYRTKDDGQNWQSMVDEAFGVMRNISRSPEGKYVAVSSRGSFYSIWEPGQDAWQQYNRTSSRRVQNMGFDRDGHLWSLLRGGKIQFSASEDPDDWQEPIYPEKATSWGLLDMAYRTSDEVWVAGGSANLLCSFDGGKTWKKDRELESVPSNFYRIKFVRPDLGFVIGQRGILLRYRGTSETA